MLKKEKPYDFKKELLKVHKEQVRDDSLAPSEDELALIGPIVILLPQDADKVVVHAARDFEDYLFTSMKLSAIVTKEPIAWGMTIQVAYNREIGSASGYMGYSIRVNDDGILLEGYDSRGIAQGFYYLEDLMNLRKAPYLKKETIRRKALFSPRLAQSPLGMFAFTDEALALMAHRGYDAIELWIKDLDETLRKEYIDLPLLCERAEKFGIDVYIELYALHSKHPDDEGAQEFYDNLYGKIFAACPKVKGFVIEGECSEFNSHDPHVGKAPRLANFVDNIPTGKMTPGWWPCSDYPQLIEMLQKAVYKHNPNADIIFCTYNWGWAPEKERIELLKNLPKGLSILITWDMFEQFNFHGSIEEIADYSLQFEGPGKYFLSEAKAAKEFGHRIYANAQVSGRTWDFGVIPYEPMPYQWLKRYSNMVQAHKEGMLHGVQECIHYGFQPSFIGDLEKAAFFTQVKPLEETIKDLLVRDFGAENLPSVDRAMHLWSDAITHYMPTNEDQYGAFRLGPSYPLWVSDPRLSSLTPLPEDGRMPDWGKVMFGNQIYFPAYTPDIAGRNSLPGVRIFPEIKEINTMAELLLEGIQVLEQIPNSNDNLLRLINLGWFMYRTCLTAINRKKLYIVMQQVSIAGSQEKAEELLSEAEAILRAERENVCQTIPLVQVDSRLGWEPSMEYTTDERGLNWKLRQLDYDLNITLPMYRKSNSL